MRIDAKALGYATALGVAGAFTVCTLVVALFPNGATAFLSYALHIDLTSLTRQLTWGGYLAGLLLTSAYMGILVAAIAGIYNYGTSRRNERGAVAASSALEHGEVNVLSAIPLQESGGNPTFDAVSKSY
jgi:hypothetical protein